MLVSSIHQIININRNVETNSDWHFIEHLLCKKRLIMKEWNTNLMFLLLKIIRCYNFPVNRKPTLFPYCNSNHLQNHKVYYNCEPWPYIGSCCRHLQASTLANTYVDINFKLIHKNKTNQKHSLIITGKKHHNPIWHLLIPPFH